MSRLRNKTVALSGASHGIGHALALALAREGADLVLNARGASATEEVANKCRELGVRAETVIGSIGHGRTARSMAARARKLGGLDGFIHAAGVLAPGPTLDTLPEHDFDAVMQASVRGAYQMIRHLLPLLAPGENVPFAVFFGSGAAEMTQPGIAAYCAAKAAEEHLARQVAAEHPELASFVFRPGVVETRMQVRARESKGAAADALHRVFRPWKEEGRLRTPEHAAAHLVNLLKGDVRALAGRTLRAD